MPGEKGNLEEEQKWNERLKSRDRHPEIRCGQPWIDWTWKRFPSTPMIEEKSEGERKMEHKAEFETDGDLKKSIPQLVCDYNFSKQLALEKNVSTETQLLLSAQSRMVAMMAQVAMKNEKVSDQMLKLQRKITILTLLIAIFTFVTIVTPFYSSITNWLLKIFCQLGGKLLNF